MCHDTLRREMEQCEMERHGMQDRLGGCFVDQRAMEMQLHQEHQRMKRERKREAMRRQLEAEHAHKQQQLLKEMEHVRARDAQRRSFFEQQQREVLE